MKYVSKWRGIASGLSALAIIAGTVGSTYAAPSVAASPTVTPPSSVVSGPQAKPSIAPGSHDAALSASKGTTNLVPTDSRGKSIQALPLAGAVANVDFTTPLNYCSRGLTYTPVKNSTTASKYIQVRLYNQGSYRDIYTTVAANSTAYPAFYHTEGAYTAYLYVWNGSSYVYDEYKTGTNTCNVSVTRVYNTGGWVELKIQNLGTAYASQLSTELAPYPAAGTYTGAHYDYPVAGGAAIYRWFSVGTSPYGIVSNTLGSYNAPVMFSGDL